MNNNKLKFFFALGLLAFSPVVVLANGNWALKENKNNLVITGDCSGQNVQIDLFQNQKNEPVYTSGSVCKEGKFEFTDNLLQWETLKDGDYAVTVNGNKENSKKVEIKRPVEEKKVSTLAVAPAVNSGVENLSSEKAVDADSVFLQAFVSLQKALLEMQEKLPETKYPAIVKSPIDLALNGLQKITGKITDLIWSADTGKIAKEVEIIEADEVLLDKAIENAKQDSLEKQAEQEAKVLKEINATEGLDVVEGGVKKIENNDLIIEKGESVSPEAITQ